jgi:methionyl-tRNA formyltransferase
MGSPEFAIPTLKALAGVVKVVGVITQADKPAGRGRVLTPQPVKKLALSMNIPFIQPGRLRDPEPMAQLLAWSPELIVVAAFGQILRHEVIELPRYGCLNVHASLLPRWRGAAPIQAAILAGDERTGVTIMRMDPGIDSGPILSQREQPILPDDTALTLGESLSELGAQLLIDILPAYLQGYLVPRPQPEAGVTYAPMLKKEAGLLDFTQPAVILSRQVRAMNPWPGSFTIWNGQVLKIHRAHAEESLQVNPGQHLINQKSPAIGTGKGLLVLDEVQPAGKKSMSGRTFLQGARSWGM